MFSVMIGNWSPAIGDPSFMGWFTVCSYYLVALLCLLKILPGKKPMDRGTRMFWFFLFMVMIVLGLQKQFNLLSAATELGRMVARHGGWMDKRRAVQAWTMAAMFIAGLIIAGALYRRVSAVCRGQSRIAVAGLVYLVLFVLLRAISLHQFGTVLNYEICGARLNWIAELTGIYWIGLVVILPQRFTDGAPWRRTEK